MLTLKIVGTSALISGMSTITVTLNFGNWEGGSHSWKWQSCKFLSFMVWISNGIFWFVQFGAWALQRSERLDRKYYSKGFTSPEYHWNKTKFQNFKNVLFTLVTADTVKSIINRLPKWKLVSSKLVESLKLSDIVPVYKEGHHI